MLKRHFLTKWKHVSGNRGCKVKRFFCDRMQKRQLPGMQALPVKKTVVRIVQKISVEGMTDVFHMNPDLMRATGF